MEEFIAVRLHSYSFHGVKPELAKTTEYETSNPDKDICLRHTFQTLGRMPCQPMHTQWSGMPNTTVGWQNQDESLYLWCIKNAALCPLQCIRPIVSEQAINIIIMFHQHNTTFLYFYGFSHLETHKQQSSCFSCLVTIDLFSVKSPCHAERDVV